MHATITTPARRIVRTARGYRAGFRLFFDTDGRLTDAIYGPEAFGPRRDTYAVCVGPDITQQGAQDALDGYAAAMAAGVGPGDAAGIDFVGGGLVQQRQGEREVAAETARLYR